MDPTIPTPTVSSTVTSSSVSIPAPPHTPLNILEISLISAQDLTPIAKSMHTYAIAWINPNKKQTTRTDHNGHTNPTWNEKFNFRVDKQLLMSEDAAVTVEIYTTAWFRDVLVGTVKVRIADLLSPPSGVPLQSLPKNMRFVALQVRRPSGDPQGILNLGVALVDTCTRSMPLTPDQDFHDEVEKKVNALRLEHGEEDEDEHRKELETRIHLWRSLSVGSGVNNDEFPQKGGSVCNGSMVNGSMVNGSELCSDIGPSASVVAAEMAMKPQAQRLPTLAKQLNKNEETGSSILEELTIEDAKAKGYRSRTNRERWRKQGSRKNSDCGESELSLVSSKHSRRNSDGGLFSCFGAAYGIEFTIVCGAPNGSKNGTSVSARRIKNKPSEANSTNSA